MTRLDLLYSLYGEVNEIDQDPWLEVYKYTAKCIPEKVLQYVWRSMIYTLEVPLVGRVKELTKNEDI